MLCYVKFTQFRYYFFLSVAIELDMRFSIDEDFDKVLKMVQGWLDEAGEGCTLETVQASPRFPLTSTENSDPWWRAFSSACNKQ